MLHSRPGETWGHPGDFDPRMENGAGSRSSHRISLIMGLLTYMGRIFAPKRTKD
jgi:hypothetical protein